jgi:hypothetical protein
MQEIQLQQLNIDPSSITVSGVSSGGFAAHQLHVAHSCHIQGAGMIAAGPYYCARGDVNRGMKVCTAFWALIAESSLPRVGLLGDFIDGWYDSGYEGPANARQSPAEARSAILEMARGAKAAADDEAAMRTIDDPSNLKNDRVFIFHGQLDKLLPWGVSEALFETYRLFGLNQNIRYDTEVPSAHAIVSDSWAGWDDAQRCDTFDLQGSFINKCDVNSCTCEGGACSQPRQEQCADACRLKTINADRAAPECTRICESQPSVEDCKAKVSTQADAAGNILKHLYVGADGQTLITAPRDAPGYERFGIGAARRSWLEKHLFKFDQARFLENDSELIGRASLGEYGYLFVPDACKSGLASCRLHIALHGCRMGTNRQGYTTLNPIFVENAGYNEWAASNNIVVLYPIITRKGYYQGTFDPLDPRTYGMSIQEGNPEACYDLWGYSGPDYHRKNGLQNRAMWAMVETLVGKERLDAMPCR